MRPTGVVLVCSLLVLLVACWALAGASQTSDAGEPNEGMQFSLLEAWTRHPGSTLQFFRLVFLILGVYASSVLIARWYAIRSLRTSSGFCAVLDSAERVGLDRAARIRAMERYVRTRSYELWRGVRTLLAIGITAPLIGMAGMVAGLTNPLRGLSLSASGGVASVSAGLVEAFEPVSVGLVIGLASFWSYAFLLRVIERETYRMYEKVIESI